MIYTMEREKYEEAGGSSSRRFDIEPDNAMVLAWAAYWRMSYVGQAWAENADASSRSPTSYALRAIKLDPDNAEALGIYAHICAFAAQGFRQGAALFRPRAALNPNLAFVWALSAVTYCYIGEPDEALERMERYRELTPFAPLFLLLENLLATAHTC